MNPEQSEVSSGHGRALEIAYSFINRRERTEVEVRTRLQRAELPADEIEQAVAELIELGYVDDARYARLFTEDRRSLDGWGSERIARALRERGVAAALISDASQEGSPLDDLARATALLRERLPAGPQADRDRNRAFGILARKGYESEIAGDAVRAWARGDLS